ncbi:MAG: T6SS immunity protein Tdi1 domain-containing protein [Rubripirellula sp.]
MKLTLDDLLVPLTEAVHATLLDDWTWLVGDAATPMLAAANGNMFYADGDAGSQIRILDAACLTVQDVCPKWDEFGAVMTIAENANEWLTPQLVGDLIESVGRLPDGHCFGFKVPPCVGGSFELDNFEHTSLPLHFGLLGQIASQVQRYPDGTPIRSFNIIDPNDEC